MSLSGLTKYEYSAWMLESGESSIMLTIYLYLSPFHPIADRCPNAFKIKSTSLGSRFARRRADSVMSAMRCPVSTIAKATEPDDAQLGTDLAKGPALLVQVGCTLNVHGATVAGKARAARSQSGSISITTSISSVPVTRLM